MEIEAKFALPDLDAFGRILELDRLAGFDLSAPSVKRVHDTYLDTADRRMLAAGYSCRRREQADGSLITLKSLSGGQGAIHRREELESLLAWDQEPNRWSGGPLRDRVLELTQGNPLRPILQLQQERTTRWVGSLGNPVAELSLDAVYITGIGMERVQYELEVELASQGSEEDLERIATHLQDGWHLLPVQRSKFERALCLLEADSATGCLLQPAERILCRQIAGRDDLHGRRAAALLGLDAGLTQVEAGLSAGMSPRRVRYWLAEYRRRRLSVFPDRVAATAQSEVHPSVAPAHPEHPCPSEAAPAIHPSSIEDLFVDYSVNRQHARSVADHALRLFDLFQDLHELPPGRRPLVEIAGLVHNIGLDTDPAAHHIAGRDILLAHPPQGLSNQERLIVALSTFMHRKRVTAKRLARLNVTPFADLPGPLMTQALALSALVRLADGLDYSQSGSSSLGHIERRGEAIEIEILGPYATVDADRTQVKSDLADMMFGTKLRFYPASVVAVQEQGDRSPVVSAPVVEPTTLIPQEPPEKPGLVEDETMTQAARKTLYFHYQRMLYHEPGTRLGEDIEELHDMRVATRRMRAAFQVFGPYLDTKQMRPIRKGLQRAGQALGAVRDLDVFWVKTEDYLRSHAPGEAPDLSALRSVWLNERERARGNMLAHLDSDRYAKFHDEFRAFLGATSGGEVPSITEKGEPVPHRVRHVVPVALCQRLAAVRAYGEWVTGPDVPLARLHRLRITVKRLRYTLEFFREVLGADAQVAIDTVKDLQDHLGDLQDAVVASNLLRDFLTWGTWGHAEATSRETPWPTELVVAPGVAAYLTARQTELQRLIGSFSQAWSSFQGEESSQLMASVIIPLL
jgi:CHAD domain-containing protein